MTTQQPHTKRGFTLVELLVVIGIIALLISILLPALNGARRSANQVKCAAALRQIGQGLQLYSAENRGYWPLAVHGAKGNPPSVPPLLTGETEKRWYHYLSRYVTSRKTLAANANTAEVTEDIRVIVNSVLWGCPSYEKDNAAINTTQFARDVRTGYGMQYYPSFFRDGGDVQKLAYADSPPAVGSPRGSYPKAKDYQRPAECGIIADSWTHIIGVPATFSRTSTLYQPYNQAAYGLGGTSIASGLYIDGARHLKPGTPKRQADKSRGTNMLFCDGHVAAVTPAEAWNSFHNPGEDRTTP